MQVGPAGILGDRRFLLIDPSNRLVAGKRLGILATIVPRRSGTSPRRSHCTFPTAR